MNSQQYYVQTPVAQPQVINYIDPNQQILNQQMPINPIQMQPMLSQYSTQTAPVSYYPNSTSYQNSQLAQSTNEHINTQNTSEMWQTVKNNKRPRSPDEAKSRKQTRLTSYWLQKPLQSETKNRFSVLQEGEEEEVGNAGSEDSRENKSEPKPPPVTVYNVGVVAHIHKLLAEVTNGNYNIKTTNPETVKIQVFKAEHYTKLIKELDTRNTQYHTYRLKSEKTFRVVIKGLHPSTEKDEIKTALKELNHEAVNIHNVRHRTDKYPLPIFFIDLQPSDNNKEIYNLKSIKNNIVKIEPPLTKRTIPQCLRCQEFGHTKNYCRKTTRCVKCAGAHLTKDCSRKIRDDKVKCINCNGDHPANYRGCIVHKQLQQQLYPALREKRYPLPPLQETPQQVLPGLSYAQVAAIHQTPIANNPQNSNMSKLEEMLTKLMEQMGTMLNLLTAVVSKLG